MPVSFSEGFLKGWDVCSPSQLFMWRGVSRFEHMKAASGLRIFWVGDPRLSCLVAYLGSEQVAGPEISLRKAS